MHEWKTKKVVILEKIEEIRSKLNHKGRGRKMAAKGLLNRVVDAIPKQYRGLFNYSAVENEGKLQLDFSLNDSREKEYLSGMGKSVVFTDKANLSTK